MRLRPRPAGRHRRAAHNARARSLLAVASLAVAAVGGISVPQAAGDDTGRTPYDVPAGQLAAALAVTPRVAQRVGVTEKTQRRERAEAVARAEEARRARAARRKALLEAARRAAAARKAAAARAARAAAERRRPKFVRPVRQYRISAVFGQAGGRWSSGAHTGLDFAAPAGTPVAAVADGVIAFAGRDGAYGNKIEMRHRDGTVSWYAHLSEIVRGSGPVRAGEVIGRVGTTGNTTGPHLHLEVHLGGAVDPMAWLREHGVRV